MNRMKPFEFNAISLKLASAEDILSWSHGEVTKPETINYRTQRPEKDGLFDEKIFGPSRDWECYCGKYKRIKYKGITCDRCGVEVTRSVVRRERMGHIKLAMPVCHLWFLRAIPSRLSLFLDIPQLQLESVVYFASYIITKINLELKERLLADLDFEYKNKVKGLPKINDDTVKLRLKQLKNDASGDLNGIKVGRVLTETEYHNLSLKYGTVFSVESGTEAIKKIIESIDLRKELKGLEEIIPEASAQNKARLISRAALIKNFIVNKIKPVSMILQILPVMPPDLRPMVQLDGGRFASADLNDLYRRVINRNNRLKKLIELNAPEVIMRNEKRMLQEAVDSLIDNTVKKTGTTIISTKRPLKSLTDVLKGKQGRFRQNLLGKRVDYSGRAVIVVGSELKMDECGIPKNMALELFKPFVIGEIIRSELAYNVRAANRLIEEGVDEVWAILESVIKNKVVLLNRAPTLHRLSIQAFKPVLIEGLAIKIHPLVCAAFNADFDGDQMAVHLPITEEAQREAQEIMLSSKNLLKLSSGQPIVRPSKDIVLGCYFLTHLVENARGEGKIYASKNEAFVAYEQGFIDINAKIKVYLNSNIRKDENKFLETSVGRIIFSQALPKDFNFTEKEMNSGTLTELVEQLIDHCGFEAVGPRLDIIKRLGFKYATLSGITWSMFELKVPIEKAEIIKKAKLEIQKIDDYFENGFLTKDEHYDRVIEVWTEAIQDIQKRVPATLSKDSSVMSIINSKARGSSVQLHQITGVRGLVLNPSGEIIDLPILNSYKEGLSVLEYFISTHGARKGTADTALKTSEAGYLTRRLVDVSQDLIVREDDCLEETGLIIVRQETISLGQTLYLKILGRITLDDIKIKEERKEKILLEKGGLVTKEIAQIIEKSTIDSVRIRSVLRCKTKFGVCRKCYGYDLGHSSLVKLGEAVGIIAAQSIGEPGTQLTMRTFHTGGVAGVGDITRGLPRVVELFEARLPKTKALLSEINGKVIDVKINGKNKTIIIEPKLIDQTTTKAKKKSKKEKETSKGNIEYQILDFLKVLVKKGDLIKAGHQLTDGHIDLKELFRLSGKEAVESYVIGEVQKIYSSEGEAIHNKHLEVILRQMFSRVKIAEVGDSEFSVGEIVEKDIVLDNNKKLKASGKKQIKYTELLLGITKVAHYANSFLSAASFQETVKVLINASLSGKVDPLRGLKENVIIGRLIPSGTSFRK
ncbi:DNA-directed RNA polymerase subunit beta' [Candidatus Azambacteria bacterium]|nr:DNA-directed RNA polymerase subunit beta' [Candidatus Azambacteria bacterium]